MKLTEDLRNEYQDLWDTCSTNSSKQTIVNNLIDKIVNGPRTTYSLVEFSTNIPWYLVATIHYMEANLNFYCHLHNGDSLNRRTIHVPSGRPVKGNPPFSWEESAIDAIDFKIQSLNNFKPKTIPEILYFLEAYNGFGYRMYHPNTLSPYLWSFSNHYVSGKYASDGRFNPGLISQQVGAAVILKELEKRQTFINVGAFK